MPLALDAVPTSVRGIAAGHIQLIAMRHRMLAVAALSGGVSEPRSLEIFWVVLAALIAHFEHGVLSRKDIGARATGAISNATLSRAVRDAERLGLVWTGPSPTDRRSQIIMPDRRAIAYVLAPQRVRRAWAAYFEVLQAALLDDPAAPALHRPVLTAWLARLQRLPASRKAIITGKLQLKAFERSLRILLGFRAPGDFSLAYETFWIVTEANIASTENRGVTQKDLTARASGMFSPATISRAIHNAEAKNFITSTAAKSDNRVRSLLPTDYALRVFWDPIRIDQAWREYMEIFTQIVPMVER